ncbi:MAG: divalent-cation tolerance protein CutA [Hyphomonadaceae bacterium]|jgi:periplasmic divalent cation tolerance protein|nr:divalent-cation tolerance protein CutA [Hyphomonadaceae bacterium]
MRDGQITATLLYTTWPDAEEAEAAGRRLINERLAACVNILPQVRSIWRDGDEVATSSEVVMVIKTSSDLAPAASARTQALHPYDIPAILELPVGPAATGTAWLAWLQQSLNGG